MHILSNNNFIIILLYVWKFLILQILLCFFVCHLYVAKDFKILLSYNYPLWYQFWGWGYLVDLLPKSTFLLKLKKHLTV